MAIIGGIRVLRSTPLAGTLLTAVFSLVSQSHAAVTISAAPTQHLSCSNGVCTPTAKKAVLNVTDLTNLLASGNVTVNTAGATASDIDIKGGFTWVSANGLTLDAYRSITVEKPVSDAGSGSLSLLTNDGGSGGEFSFSSKGSISFLGTSNALTINGVAYTLANSVSSLASDIAANPSGNYALSSSYDASKDGTYFNSPISTELAGAVQGLGNTISNLSIDVVEGRAYRLALFASVANGGSLQNFRVENATIRASRSPDTVVAALVAVNAGLLFGDEATGSVSATHCCARSTTAAGGLAAVNTGTIMNSTAKVKVASPYDGGGLVADSSGTIKVSSASGSVRAGTAGGLVGNNDRGSIDQSFATGAVTGGDQSRVGGLVGLKQNNDTLTNSYATGAVTGGMNAYVGGSTGEDLTLSMPSIANSYSTGAVAAGTGSLAGGFEGDNDSFSDCYWDTTTSGTNQGTGLGNANGLTGLTTQQLQSGLPAGFDPTIWVENPNINNGFPYLINNPPPKKK